MLVFGMWTAGMCQCGLICARGSVSGLFLNDQDPSDVGDINGLNIVRIVNEVWLRFFQRLPRSNRSLQGHTDHVGFFTHLGAIRPCQSEIAGHETFRSGCLYEGEQIWAWSRTK